MFEVFFGFLEKVASHLIIIGNLWNKTETTMTNLADFLALTFIIIIVLLELINITQANKKLKANTTIQ